MLQKIFEEIIKEDYYKVTKENPDPILIAQQKKDEVISLACALFAYGKATLIVKFLESINFDILNENEIEIKKYINHYYRFQNIQDVKEFFITLKRLKDCSLEDIFYEKYKINNFVIDGIDNLIKTIYSINPYTSKGYTFLIGNRYKGKTKSTSPYKRWNMYLRWMVRDEGIDFGLWKKVNKK